MFRLSILLVGFALFSSAAFANRSSGYARHARPSVSHNAPHLSFAALQANATYVTGARSGGTVKARETNRPPNSGTVRQKQAALYEAHRLHSGKFSKQERRVLARSRENLLIAINSQLRREAGLKPIGSRKMRRMIRRREKQINPYRWIGDGVKVKTGELGPSENMQGHSQNLAARKANSEGTILVIPGADGVVGVVHADNTVGVYRLSELQPAKKGRTKKPGLADSLWLPGFKPSDL
jgi:hypothetical protein